MENRVQRVQQLIQPETGDVHQKEILTMHEGKIYFLFLSGYPIEVAKPETREILDHVIESVKWTTP